MPLRLIGAGVGRTATHSLKLAIERLLGAPCYHMRELFGKEEHMALWTAAARGEDVDWEALFDGYVAAVDWPASAFWPELMERYPDAPVFLSVRDPESWWRSASNTIFPSLLRQRGDPEGGPFYEMVMTLLKHRFTGRIEDRAAAIAAFEAHNARVMEEVPAERLVLWRASDGWGPLCAALGVPVPDEPFPRSNSTEEWRERRAAEAAQRAAEEGEAPSTDG